MGRELKDYTGRKINGWEVLRCVSFGGNRDSRWIARHTCGHEQEVAIKQLTDGRPGLCNHCGKTNLRKEAAKVASMVAARTPRGKKGPTLVETIDRTKRAVDAIKHRPAGAVSTERREDTWDVIREVQRLLDGNQRQGARC